MNELEYYRQRIAREDECAGRVVGTEAELIHRCMAARYAQLALEYLSRSAGNDSEPYPHRSAS